MLRVASDSEDWVQAAKNLRNSQHKQELLREQEEELARQQLFEIEAEQRLVQAEALMAIKQEEFLAECEGLSMMPMMLFDDVIVILMQLFVFGILLFVLRILLFVLGL